MFSITTPIYYVNDEPHLGHAYTTILADVLAGYHRLRGEEVFFLTGLDEHGQKVWNAYKKRHEGQSLGPNPLIPPSLRGKGEAERLVVEGQSGVASDLQGLQAYVDEMAARFQAAWERLNIHYDDFLRTTQPRHKRVVERVLQDLWDKGQIYRGQYEGWYCVPDERFWTEKDAVADGDGTAAVARCPDCGRPLERIVETNYFFRMSQHQEWLVEYIHAHPDFIQPAYRRNEVLGFLRRPLGDLCISRPKTRLPWGIPLPFDTDFVTYVWFDALLNYVTAAGYLDDDARFQKIWPETMHLIGKDILTTHAVYWPTMLHAAGIPQPRLILAHGWWVIGGEKMSKSLGNAVKPLDLADVFGVDAFRYFLLRDMAPGQDADFDPQRLAARYTTDLANNLGNLLQRITTLVGRTCGGRVPTPVEEALKEEEMVQLRHLRNQIEALPERVFAAVDKAAVHEGLAAVMSGLDAINGYLERAAPWTLAKQQLSERGAEDGGADRVATILYMAGEALRFASVLLAPVLLEKCSETWQRLGWSAPERLADGLRWGAWQPGSPVTVGEALFPKKENVL